MPIFDQNRPIEGALPSKVVERQTPADQLDPFGPARRNQQAVELKDRKQLAKEIGEATATQLAHYQEYYHRELVEELQKGQSDQSGLLTALVGVVGKVGTDILAEKMTSGEIGGGLVDKVVGGIGKAIGGVGNLLQSIPGIGKLVEFAKGLLGEKEAGAAEVKEAEAVRPTDADLQATFGVYPQEGVVPPAEPTTQPSVSDVADAISTETVLPSSSVIPPPEGEEGPPPPEAPPPGPEVSPKPPTPSPVQPGPTGAAATPLETVEAPTLRIDQLQGAVDELADTLRGAAAEISEDSIRPQSEGTVGAEDEPLLLEEMKPDPGVVKEFKKELGRGVIPQLDLLGGKSKQTYVDPVASLSDEDLLARAKSLEGQEVPMPRGISKSVAKRIQGAWQELGQIWPEGLEQIKEVRELTPKEQRRAEQAAGGGYGSSANSELVAQADVGRNRSGILLPRGGGEVSAADLAHEAIHLFQNKDDPTRFAHGNYRNDSGGLTQSGVEAETEAYHREYQFRGALKRLQGFRKQGLLGKLRKSEDSLEQLGESASEPETVDQPQKRTVLPTEEEPEEEGPYPGPRSFMMDVAFGASSPIKTVNYLGRQLMEWFSPEKKTGAVKEPRKSKQKPTKQPTPAESETAVEPEVPEGAVTLKQPETEESLEHLTPEEQDIREGEAYLKEEEAKDEEKAKTPGLLKRAFRKVKGFFSPKEPVEGEQPEAPKVTEGEESTVGWLGKITSLFTGTGGGAAAGGVGGAVTGFLGSLLSGKGFGASLTTGAMGGVGGAATGGLGELLGLGGVGSAALGAATGGIVPAVMAGGKMIGNMIGGGIEKVGSAVSKPFDLATGALDLIGGGGTKPGFFSGMASAVPSAKDAPGASLMSMATFGASDKMLETIDKVKEKAALVADAFTTLIKNGIDPATMYIQKWIEPFVNQVGKFNPAIVERLNIQLDNLTAAAGRMFQPVIEEATRFAQDLNALYTGIAGPIQGIFQTVSTEVADFGREFFAGVSLVVKSLAEALGPALKQLTGVGEQTASFLSRPLGVLAEGITALAPVFEVLATTIAVVIDIFDIFRGSVAATAAVMSEIGERLSSGNFTGAGRQSLHDVFNTAFADSTKSITQGQAIPGAQTQAAQQARQIGLEEIGQQARASAFSMAADIPQQQLQTQQQILATLVSQNSFLQAMLGQNSTSAAMSWIAGNSES